MAICYFLYSAFCKRWLLKLGCKRIKKAIYICICCLFFPLWIKLCAICAGVYSTSCGRSLIAGLQTQALIFTNYFKKKEPFSYQYCDIYLKVFFSNVLQPFLERKCCLQLLGNYLFPLCKSVWVLNSESGFVKLIIFLGNLLYQL